MNTIQYQHYKISTLQYQYYTISTLYNIYVKKDTGTA